MNKKLQREFISKHRKMAQQQCIRRMDSIEARNEQIGRLQVLHQLAAVGLHDVDLMREIELEIGRVKHFGRIDVYVARSDVPGWTVYVDQGFEQKHIGSAMGMIHYGHRATFGEAYAFAMTLALKEKLGVWFYFETHTRYVNGADVGSYLASYPTGEGAVYPEGQEPLAVLP